MTLLQLKVAVATAEIKSVSGAAKLLNTSQPNASNCLKLLEEELGFPVFMRTSAGAALTAKGAQFIEYARQMLDANEKVLCLRNAEEIYRLRLGTVNYYAAAEPLFTLCNEHKEDLKADFKYLNVSVAEGIQELAGRGLDVVVAPVLKHQITGLVSECKKEHIELTSICHVPAVIMVRKDHPAALDGRCSKISQGCDAMKEFPYVGFKNLKEDSGSTGYNDSDFIQCSYKMYFEDTNARLRMIEASNGFGFGIMTSRRIMDQYGLSFFPVQGISLEMFCLTRPGEISQRSINEYITLLKKEMLQLIKK